ncbi:MAG TPA: hypothetical protein VI039_13140 [Solirubrobacterales bacterium]
MAEVKQGARLNDPPGRILRSSGFAIEVDDETNRRWLAEEVESCKAAEAEVGRRMAEVEGELTEVQEERARYEKELTDAV